MELQTERLKILALTPENLELLVNNRIKFEEKLGCQYCAQNIEGIFKNILINQISKAKNDRKNYLWHTFWIIIRKYDNIVVGTIDFKNLPQENGEVEIGYGLGEEHEHHGYMTEALKAMCYWAKNQNHIKSIIAETEIGNTASERVLKRCGFKEYLRNTSIWWRV